MKRPFPNPFAPRLPLCRSFFSASIAILACLLLLNLLGNGLLAQGPPLAGRYQAIASIGGSPRELEADTIVCLKLDAANETFENGAYYFRFHLDTLEEESSYWASYPEDTSLISGTYWLLRLISYPKTAKGSDWFCVKGYEADSRYYRQRDDTLWLYKMTAGELPIRFDGKGTRLMDMLGLHLLLPVIGAVSRNSRGSRIEIFVRDPLAAAPTKRGRRMAAQRLLVLRALLQEGLGDAYGRIRIVEQVCEDRKAAYSANYRID